MIRIKKISWHTFLWLNWAIILWFWWDSFSGSFALGSANIILALGSLAGLFAAYLILLQFFFMGRTPWIERLFGLDKLSQIHHQAGKYGILLILIHPLLIVWGYSRLGKISLTSQLINFISSSDDLLKAVLALSGFILVVVSSLVIVRKRLRYESWYFVHLLAYLSVAGAYGHQAELGTTLTSHAIFYWYWLFLYALVFSNQLIFRFLRPIYNFWKHKFFVAKIVRENYNTVSVYIGGEDLNSFNIFAGQFMILRFFAKGLWYQAHPFSLSLAPNGKELRVTIKQLGDFTKQIENLKPGTRLLIDGPYGVFTDFFSLSNKVLLIAGGIGITPLRALLEDMQKKGKDITLLYGNREKKDIVFEQEMDNLTKQHPARVIHVLSEEPGFTGERGYVDEEKIKRLVPDLASRDIYICGPPPMMKAIIQTLNKLDVKSARLHFEKFSLS